MSNFEDMRTILPRAARKGRRSYGGGDATFQQTPYADAYPSTTTQLDALSEYEEEQMETPDRRLIVLPTQKREHAEPSQTQICPKCHGTKWLRSQLPTWDPNYRSRVECECLLEERRTKRREAMLGLCTQLGFRREMTLATYRAQVRGVQVAVRTTKAFIDFMIDWGSQRREVVRAGSNAGPGPAGMWIVFVGPVGVGKTHLAMAIGNACIDADIETLFATVPDLLDHLRAAFAPTATIVYDELFERLRNCELLILDDLGAERSSPWADEKLFQLLNYRYNLSLPTVVTMNQKSWTYLDDRLQTRLSDVSLVESVRIEQARNYRIPQSKATHTALQEVKGERKI